MKQYSQRAFRFLLALTTLSCLLGLSNEAEAKDTDIIREKALPHQVTEYTVKKTGKKTSHTVEGTDAETPGIGKYAVRVTVYDDTKANPIPPRANIWFRGHGSWWLKQAANNGADTKILGNVNGGVVQRLVLYPEGENGKEIVIPYMKTQGMSKKPTPRYTLVMAFKDNEIVVYGDSIRAATGEFEISYPR